MTAMAPNVDRSLPVASPHQISTPASSRKSRLLELPAELRNEIYELALFQTRPIGVTIVLEHCLTLLDFTRASRRSLVEEPPLLTCCRQVREEAIGIFYGSSTFASSERSELERWIIALPAAKRKLLRDVRVPFPIKSYSLHDLNCGSAVLAFELDRFELRLRQQGVFVDPGVLRAFAYWKKEDTALTIAEIKASFSQRHWEAYRDLKKKFKVHWKRGDPLQDILKRRKPKRVFYSMM